MNLQPTQERFQRYLKQRTELIEESVNKVFRGLNLKFGNNIPLKYTDNYQIFRKTNCIHWHRLTKRFGHLNGNFMKREADNYSDQSYTIMGNFIADYLLQIYNYIKTILARNNKNNGIKQIIMYIVLVLFGIQYQPDRSKPTFVIAGTYIQRSQSLQNTLSLICNAPEISKFINDYKNNAKKNNNVHINARQFRQDLVGFIKQLYINGNVHNSNHNNNVNSRYYAFLKKKNACLKTEHAFFKTCLMLMSGNELKYMKKMNKKKKSGIQKKININNITNGDDEKQEQQQLFPDYQVNNINANNAVLPSTTAAFCTNSTSPVPIQSSNTSPPFTSVFDKYGFQ